MSFILVPIGAALIAIYGMGAAFTAWIWDEFIEDDLMYLAATFWPIFLPLGGGIILAGHIIHTLTGDES